MFEEVKLQSERLRRFALFGLQPLLIPPAGVVIGLTISALFVPRAYEHPLRGVLSIYGSPGLMGFMLADVVQARWQDAHRSGRWIWLLPFLVWAHDALLDIRWSGDLNDEFAPSGSTEGLILRLSTIPTLTCICYSIRMATLAYRVGKRNTQKLAVKQP